MSSCRGDEGDLEKVVPPERVVGVLDVVLAERDRHTRGRRRSVTHQVTAGPVCGSVTEPRPGRPGQPGQPADRRLGVGRHRSRVLVTRVAPSRAEQGAATPLVVRRLGSPASSTSMATRRLVRCARPTIASTCALASASVCSIHGMPPTTSAPRRVASMTQALRCAGALSSPSWGRRRPGLVDPPRNLARPEQPLDTGQARDRVDIGEGLDDPDPRCSRGQQSLPGAGVHVVSGLAALDRRGALDGGEGAAHGARGVLGQGVVAGRVEGVDLAGCRWASTKGMVTVALGVEAPGGAFVGGNRCGRLLPLDGADRVLVEDDRPGAGAAPGGIAGRPARVGHPLDASQGVRGRQGAWEGRRVFRVGRGGGC